MTDGAGSWDHLLLGKASRAALDVPAAGSPGLFLVSLNGDSAFPCPVRAEPSSFPSADGIPASSLCFHIQNSPAWSMGKSLELCPSMDVRGGEKAEEQMEKRKAAALGWGLLIPVSLR